MNTAIAQAVIARADGFCEACGGPMRPEDSPLHHRLLRKQGGLDSLENLIQVHWVCHNGHTNSIHSKVERSYRFGHLLKFGWDAAEHPVIVVPNLLYLRQ